MLNKRFTFLCSEEERDKLTRLAQSLHRSRGDSLRLLLRQATQSKFQLDQKNLAENNDLFVKDTGPLGTL